MLCAYLLSNLFTNVDFYYVGTIQAVVASDCDCRFGTSCADCAVHVVTAIICQRLEVLPYAFSPSYRYCRVFFAVEECATVVYKY